MKIWVISGSLPPEPCGVGDYSSQLARSLEDCCIEAEAVRMSSRPLHRIASLSKRSIVHIQYPSRGYGWSLMPQLLAVVSRNLIVTIHEFSQSHLLRRIAIVPLLLFSRAIVVSNQFEADSIIGWIPTARAKLHVIPVGAAVVPQREIPPVEARTGVVFFGLMRPDKGVEEFIELSRKLLTAGKTLSVAIYCAVPKSNESYYVSLRAATVDLEISWHINEPLEVVSEGLLRARYAYLHFPDGVTERRSSFIAAISHGLIVLSNSGNMTPVRLVDGFTESSNPLEARDTIEWYEANPEALKGAQCRALDAALNYSWPRICSQHIALYRSLEGSSRESRSST